MSSGRPVHAVVAVLTGWAVVLGLAGPATAADDADFAPTTLTLAGTARYADRPTDLVATLVTTAEVAPVAGAQVVVERRTGGEWAEVGTVPTDAAGQASVEAVLSRAPDDNVFRARWAGDATYARAPRGR